MTRNAFCTQRGCESYKIRQLSRMSWVTIERSPTTMPIKTHLDFTDCIVFNENDAAPVRNCFSHSRDVIISFPPIARVRLMCEQRTRASPTARSSSATCVTSDATREQKSVESGDCQELRNAVCSLKKRSGRQGGCRRPPCPEDLETHVIRFPPPRRGAEGSSSPFGTAPIGARANNPRDFK